ncbi:DUF1127 domain-containing protein [Acidisphaera sp. L21]|uniref:DUF1127 domain-containing protein n=1 Tax=Acidisphaera sp. L21 TaxID=1641851 RepID=UPI00131DB7F2|nr:DUF1127 domain-containing protein [Acidisphaera sp. L21]
MSQTVTKLRIVPAQPRWQDRLVAVWHRIGAAWQDAATRRQLAELGDRELSDIGVSRAQANFMNERPVWELFPGNHR